NRYMCFLTPLINTLSSLVPRCITVPCPVAGWISCGIHSLSLHQTPAQQNFMVPSTTKLTTTVKCSNLSSQSYTMIYRLPHIKLLRVVSRLKLLQTAITVVILPPVYYYYLQGDVPVFLVGYTTGIALFAGAMLYTASHFFRRVVGMMYLDPTWTTLKVSHLTFWGKRSDLFFPVSDVMTIADTGDNPNEGILKLKTYSSPHTFYFSTHYGHVADQDGFEKVFGKIKR
uniref:Transmembrane protein 186 n=1 Tax=Neogobius melanostomus TaxID=47308 RepID=A0A8C6UK88_9GOBI